MEITTVNNGLHFTHKLNQPKTVISENLVTYTKSKGLEHIAEIRTYRTKGKYGNIFTLALLIHDHKKRNFTYFTAKGDAVHECIYQVLSKVFNIKPDGNYIDCADILEMYANYAGYKQYIYLSTP